MENIISNPDWLAYALNFDAEEIEFINVGEQALRNVAWLREDAFPADATKLSVPLSKLQSLADAEVEQPIAFIFHTAYCGSTFASRCLDFPTKTLALREPQLLLDAANAKRGRWQAKSANMDYRHLIRLALNLLSKHSSGQEKTVIKPINSVNNIAAELLASAPNSRALMLYTDARSFLLSTLKKGEAARQITRAMFDLLRCDFQYLNNLQLSDVIHLSDLKLIMTLWRLQLEQVDAVLKGAGAERMRSLHAEDLVERAADSIHSANEFLFLGLTDQELAQNLARLGKADAKDAEQEFSAEKRDTRYQEIERFYGDDLDAIYHWVQSNNPHTSLRPALANALLA